jgi:zona occludens toxin (predicted ATPase)
MSKPQNHKANTNVYAHYGYQSGILCSLTGQSASEIHRCINITIEMVYRVSLFLAIANINRGTDSQHSSICKNAFEGFARTNARVNITIDYC